MRQRQDHGSTVYAVVDSDLELRAGGLDLLAFFPSVVSSFLTKQRGEGAGPSPRSATNMYISYYKCELAQWV